jgi:hypothetical protein
MRYPVSDDILAQLVGEQLQDCIASGAEFTAYEITRVLRTEQPHLDIRHDAVRAWVHRFMQGVISAGLYTASRRDFGFQEAVVYEPSLVTTVPVLPTVPISLN